MTEQTNEPKKKMTLQEAMQQQLERKKSQQAAVKGNKKGDLSTPKMKSQQTKKASNTRRKMGV